jgi:lysophospholipase L1-like esterase
MSRPVAVLTLTVFMGVLSTAVGCGSTEPQRVALVGDSITNIVGPQLQSDGPHEWQVEATDGITAPEMVERAQMLAATAPDQVVVNLGTNDALQQKSVEEAIAAIGSIVDAFGGARCIHLVTLSARLPSFGQTPPAPETAERINEWIRTVADERDRVRVIEWDEEVGDDDGLELLKADRIHPNAEGQERLRDLIERAVGGC